MNSIIYINIWFHTYKPIVLIVSILTANKYPPSPLSDLQCRVKSQPEIYVAIVADLFNAAYIDHGRVHFFPILIPYIEYYNITKAMMS